MVTASAIPLIDDDLAPRRPATVEAIDARLSVWGQASRVALGRRADSLAEAAIAFAELHGREAARVATTPVDGVAAMLGTGAEDLARLAASLMPHCVRSSCRILWVDPDRLTESILASAQPHLDGARAEIRRVQALHRRRARLWRDDPDRLNQLREDVEALSVPRAGPRVVAGALAGLERQLSRADMRA